MPQLFPVEIRRPKKRGKLIPLIIVFLFLFVGLASPVRGVLQSALWGHQNRISSLFADLGRRTRRFASIFKQISSLRQENKELAMRITELEVDKSKIYELEHENVLLKHELGFMESDQSKELVPAKIVARDSVSYLDYVIINRGQDSNIKANMAVVSGGALVGQISEVYANQSKVILITSKDSIVQAMLQGSRSKGVLRGGISGLSLEQVAADADFSPDENVITSGLGGKFAEGLLIGRAGTVRISGSGILKSIVVDPAVDLSRLEMIFVVK